RCVTEARPVLVARVGEADLPRIAADAQGAALLAKAGLHSYLAVPLIARGEVLGALSLYRLHNQLPFDEDDAVLAVELAARAAVCIDNARSYQSERRTALTLQRHLMNHRPPQPAGMEIAYRYQPAQAASEVGGDWFDAIPVAGPGCGTGPPAPRSASAASPSSRPPCRWPTATGSSSIPTG